MSEKCQYWKSLLFVPLRRNQPAQRASATKLGQPRCLIRAFARSIFVASLLNLREVPVTHSKWT